MLSRFTIAGADVPAQSVARRAMNFGQPISGRQPLPYELSVALSELPKLLDAQHASTARELQEDAALGDEDEIAAELRVLGWPPLARLAENHAALLARYLHRYLADELLDSVTRTPASDATYQINSVDELFVREQRLILRGECYQS